MRATIGLAAMLISTAWRPTGELGILVGDADDPNKVIDHLRHAESGRRAAE